MTFARARALVFVAVLLITAGTVVLTAVLRDTQTKVSTVNECPSGLIQARTRMPERNQVTLNVYNGTDRVNLARQVAEELKFRGFNIHKIGNVKKHVDEIAVIVYGPDAVGAAYLASANFLVDEAVMTFDINRKGGEVDVTLGTKFQQLATSTEVNLSIAAIGNPLLPPGTCNAPGNKG